MWPSWAKGGAQQLIQLLDRNLEPPLRRVWWSHGNQNYGFGMVWEFGIVFWLVVWNMNFIFPYTGNSHPNWLSYFSEGLKPPTCIVWEGFSIQYISSTVSCGCGCTSLRLHGQFFTWLESWLDFGQFLSSWQRLCIISGARNRGPLRGPGSWPVWLMFLPATKLQTAEPRHPKLEEFLETLETLMRLLGQAWPKYIWRNMWKEGRFFLKAPKGRHIQTCIPTAYVLEYSVKGPTSEPFLGWLSGWWFHGLILFWSFPTTQGYSPNTYFCWPQSTLRKGFLSEESLDHDDWDNHPPLYLILEGETANKL